MVPENMREYQRARGSTVKKESNLTASQKIKSVYPSPGEISPLDKNYAFLPKTLPVLTAIFNEKNVEQKRASIGQSIVQAARPRVLKAPLQIGLAVQMHEHFYPNSN